MQINYTKLLGKGGFGSVYEGSLNGVPVAIKEIETEVNGEMLRHLLSEIQPMIHLSGAKHIISLLGISFANSFGEVSTGKFYFRLKTFCIMEIMPVDLNKLIFHSKVALTSK